MRSPEKMKMTPSLFKCILVETLKGKSLARILMNQTLTDVTITGDIIDIGSGSDSASYNRFLKFKKPYNIIFTDFYKNGKNIIKLNAENKFDIKDKTYDVVLCFNLLEHVFNYRNVVTESHRILKKSGTFIGFTPFLILFHPDPNDYFRYSHQALERLFEEEGYKCEKIKYCGLGPFTAAYNTVMGLIPKILRPVFLIPCLSLDFVICKVGKNSLKYPLGYMFIFKK